ncbi:PGPGW domain-containing protein [Nocardioides sp. cx-173]|uniref:PGPGW domain-containing protein n=1 Tax=Nocardioides sp. cx-173 TaxID=2898796 RepID=UPI001E60CDAA|nr:PGPGW domain-containing protein [Nocardioides sp. cx-173]MCD4523516.1 PGPGW domain-containing protein [Nocardioides sp. cx-173]UGB42146.1 PGPGW domain-containing protein [Nocardioides sp. cx-173]
MRTAAKRIGLETVGWVLVVAGIAALVLPGPGLLMVFGGLAILSQQYEWAERRLAPIKFRALKGAAESVETLPRIVISIIGVLVLLAAGGLWIASPPSPEWWPLSDTWWLPGGLATAVTQIASAFIAMGLIVYSYRRFHGDPDAVARLEEDLERADADARWSED